MEKGRGLGSCRILGVRTPMNDSITRFDGRAFLRSKLLPLVTFGLIALYNWSRWQRDRQVLSEQSFSPAIEPPKNWADVPLVSVMVAAWNESATIGAHIQSFHALRYPRKQLV